MTLPRIVRAFEVLKCPTHSTVSLLRFFLSRVFTTRPLDVYYLCELKAKPLYASECLHNDPNNKPD